MSHRKGAAVVWRLVILFGVLSLNARANCVVAIPDDCPEGKVCAKFNKQGESKCFPIQEAAPIVFDLPFDSRSKVICAQSGRFSSATHVYLNMLYAIDLASPYDKPPAKIHASAAGKAFVFSGCKSPSGKPAHTETDDCGLGYGNHVKLLHDDGYISIYAHLSEVYVKTGDIIKQHQQIGLEGATGQAAYRHLHWDVHKLEEPKEKWEWHLLNPGWGGSSVPFKFKVKINESIKVVDSSKIACRWLDMNQAPWAGAYISTP